MKKNQTVDPWTLEGIPRLGPIYRGKLEKAGILDHFSMVIQGPTQVMDITGMDKDDAIEAVNFCRMHLVATGKLARDFRPATDILQDRLAIQKIKTGSEKLDEVLGGGIETKAVTEFYGEFGSGKTQLCFRLTVNAQLPVEKGGLDGQVLYIDTENTFRPERIATIGSNIFKDNPLDNILVARAYNSSHQAMIIDEIGNFIHERKDGKKPLKLVIVDSMMALLRAEFLGQAFLARRQQLLNSMLVKLERLSEAHNLAVVITNQVYDRTDSFGISEVAAGGNIMAHGTTYRIWLRKKGKIKIARIVDSPMHPQSEVLFQTSEKLGIEDVQNDA